MMKNVKMKIMQEIVNLRYEMDDYREMRMFHKVAEIRLEIARLETLLSETY
jgi:ribosomal protein L29